MRFDRMSGLYSAQLDELEQMIIDLLEEPWDKGNGRPRELTLREALLVTSGYARNNITEEVWAEIFDVDQSTISRHITLLTPLIEQATTEFRPSAEEAAEATRDAIALVDGTLWPCWSWDGESKLWSGKHKTTGHASLIVTNLQGRVTFVSEPVTAILVADDLAARLISLLADAGRKRLTSWLLGDEQERALRQAATAAVESAVGDQLAGDGTAVSRS